MKTKKVAIIGASGYSGEELVNLLLHHPHAELVAVTSRQNAGQTLAQVFPKFASHPKSKTLRFSEPNAEILAKQADVVFLALPHESELPEDLQEQVNHITQRAGSWVTYKRPRGDNVTLAAVPLQQYLDARDLMAVEMAETR